MAEFTKQSLIKDGGWADNQTLDKDQTQTKPNSLQNQNQPKNQRKPKTKLKTKDKPETKIKTEKNQLWLSNAVFVMITAILHMYLYFQNEHSWKDP